MIINYLDGFTYENDKQIIGEMNQHMENRNGLRWDETNVNHRILSAPAVWHDLKYKQERKDSEKRHDPTITRQRCGCVKNLAGESIHTCSMHWDKKTGK